MASARYRGVGKRWGETVALEDFSLDVADGELVAVLGPSGCGKSTVLRLTAGLDEPTSGEIHLGERRIDALPAHERDVAMVFQSYALYPHMTVRGNVEFPLRMRGVARDERRARAEQVAELLEIGPFLERKPAALSGGQRQRVALARALVREPALFLLDEPLSNLDARLRGSVRQYIRDVQRRVGVTTLYVTHDQTEAMTLGHRLVVLDRGRIQQVGEPLAVYEQPANAFVASFLGEPPMNLLRGRVDGDVLVVAGQRLAVPSALRAPLRAALGGTSGEVTVGVRAEAFEPAPAAAAAAAAATTSTAPTVSSARGEGLPGLVVDPDPATRELLGGETLVRARVADESIVIRLFGSGAELPARLFTPAEALHVFSAADGRRIGP